ncbi:MAG: leucyl aminopeptidase [Nitrospirae bacterium]|nr:MAG: leucyl aminopeptidase [Nitrospirota bacterium]
MSSKERKKKKINIEAVIFPLFQNNNDLSGLPEEVSATVEMLFKEKIFTAELNKTYPIALPGRKNLLLLLTGLGEREKINNERLRQAGGSAGSFCKEKQIPFIKVELSNLKGILPSPVSFLEGLFLSTYSFSRYLSDKEPYSPTVTVSGIKAGLKKQIPEIKAITDSVHLARDLVNTPSNELTPEKLASRARQLGTKNIKVKVLTERQIEKEGMGAYLAVSRGSKNPPRFIVIEYRGGKKGPVVFIGKSITFDSGGISIKPSSGMEKMKYDMAGGAAVLSAVSAAAKLSLPVHIIGILPAAENMPGGNATRPGDIVSTLSGKTIEIANTDAEGRLALADAIEYAKRYDPDFIVDIATLTGACSVALGNEAAAAMSNSEELIKRAVRASEQTGEKLWPMPLYEEYRDYLKSDVADIRNVSTDRSGSLVTAACFLKDFVEDVPWLHIDIASVAWTDRDRPYIPKGATGFGVRLLIQLLKESYKL